MRIRKLSAAIALGAAALGLSACAERSTPPFRATRRCRRRRARPSSSCRPAASPTTAASSSSAMPGSSPSSCRRAAITPATNRAEREHGRAVRLRRRPRPGPLRRGSVLRRPRPTAMAAFRARCGFYRPRFGWGWGGAYSWGWDDPFWYGGGIDSYVEYHSQIDLHIRQAATNAPLFDGRAQARSETNRLDVVDPEPGRCDVHRLPGPQRRNGEDHHPDAPTAARLNARGIASKRPVGAIRRAFSLAERCDQPSSWRVSRRMSASSSASLARSFSICRTAWITVV